MISKLTSIIFIAVIAALMTSCSNRIDESSIDADRLCSLADTAFAKQDFSELQSALKKQFHVAEKEMRITDQGIFVPVRTWFVGEKGYFLARPGANIILKIGDPALFRVKECIFRYRIKG